MKRLSGWKRLWVFCSLSLFIPVAIYLCNVISENITQNDRLYISGSKASLISSEAIRLKRFGEAAIECKQQPFNMMIYGYTEVMHIPLSRVIDQIKKDCAGKVDFEDVEKKASKEIASQTMSNILFYSKYLLGVLVACIAITGAILGIVRWIILGFLKEKA